MNHLSSDTAVDQVASWKARQLFPEVDMENLSVFLEKELSNKGIPSTLSKGDEFTPDMIKAPENRGNFSEITSVQIKLPEGPRRGRTVDFEVTLQTGNIVSVIIPQNDKVLVEAFKTGSRLTEIMCFTGMGLSQKSGVVAGKKVIPSGPKRGDYSLYIALEVD